jgi:predicted outer membrane repeat protein
MPRACPPSRVPPLLEPLEPRLLLSGEAGDAVYLLITSEALKQAFQPLVDRRTGQGKQGELVTTETIEATYPGTDLQERIRNCVIDHYQNHGTVFVALGGDDTVVPVRYCWAKEKNCPADLYYADMDGGNWDADGDGVYGEAGDVSVVELTPEICPGRIPVRTPDQAAAYIRKVVAYEDASPDGFANSMIIFSASGSVSGEDRPLDFRDYDPVCSPEAKWTRFYWEEIQPYWQATPRHRFTRCYTSWDEGACGDYPLTAQNLTEKLNWGYHYVVYTGHAGPRHYCLEDSAFHASDAASLTNGTRPSIVISGGCSAAYYDWPEDPAMGEAFVRNPNGGAVVFLGYARSVFTGIHMEQLQREIFQNGRRVIGEAFAHCMAAMAPELNLYHQYIYTLLGDPAITLLGEEGGRHLQIASPAGCEVIDTDSDLTIRWNASGAGWSPDEKVNLEYSDDGGTTWVPVPGAEAIPFNGRLFAWECPRLAQGNGYRVRVTAVSAPAVTDESRTDFTIHDLGVLTVQSTPVRNVTVAGSHAGTTDYTFSAMVGGPVELTTPQEVGDLTFARWTDGAGTALSQERACRFTFTGDTTVVAEYEYAHPISQYYYVNDEIPEIGIAAGDDANDGLTPQAPMRHIQALLDRYPDIGWGCAVQVSAGVYLENLALGALHTGLTLEGAGADATRIDAGGLGRCLSLDGLVAGTVCGITFTGGHAPDGAAMRCTDSSLSITDCAFVRNQADDRGGAICIEGDSAPRISRCAFVANRADTGGAVWSREWAAPRFELCTFVGNQSRGNGGAVLNTGYCSAVLEDCVFTGNQSTTFGGALACQDDSAALLSFAKAM